MLVIINIGTLDCQALYHHPTQTQASDRGTWRKTQIDWQTATFSFQFLSETLTNQKGNLDIKSGLIQFRAFSMQPFKGLQCILACIHTSTCLPEQTSSLRSKCFRMSSLRKLGREQKKASILMSCQYTNEPNREISRGVFLNRGVCGQAFPLLPSPPPFHFFCSRSNFRAITRLEMLATQANKPQEFLTILDTMYAPGGPVTIGGAFEHHFWLGRLGPGPSCSKGG